ncbi:hypothetical protein [Rhizobium sp. TH2]|uniref:hypothetical protein n=1 Tax=Rhizobium sp. TH2 TaxID=2775403 RepID=UPI002157FAE3|nr:hypothetical protein [Rhizobium sp. TH2]
MTRATVRLFEAWYSGDEDLNDLALLSGSKNRAVFVDRTSLDEVIIEGTNLDYAHGILKSGVVEKFTRADANGDKFMSIEDFKVDARFLLGDTFFEQFGEISGRAVSGNVRAIGTNLADTMGRPGAKSEILIGRGGDDSLAGGLGRDILTGGAGNDNFAFVASYGNDVITDFDATGGVGFQDLINGTFADVDHIVKSGKNTILDFGGGDTLTLLNVKPSQIDDTDFV